MATNPNKREESIFLELQWLGILADDAALAPEFNALLKRSHMWRLVHPRPRRYPHRGAVAIIAATALFPRPVLAQGTENATHSSDTAIRIHVRDAWSGKPLNGARIVSRSGALKGITTEKGQATVLSENLEGGSLSIEVDGYKPFHLVVFNLGPKKNTHVGLSRLPGYVPLDEQQAEAQKPAVAKASPKPHVAAKPRATPKPAHVAVEPDEPRVRETQGAPNAHVTPKPAPKAAAKPAAKPAPHVVTKHAEHPAPHAAAKHAEKHATKPAKPKIRTIVVKATPVAEAEPPAITVEEPTHEPIELAPAEPAPPEHVAPARTKVHGSTYRIASGDTLWDISQRELGNPYLWSALYRANRRKIHNPNLIHPGQILQIPTERLATAARSAHAGTGGGKVKVHSGDSLWEIAGQHLGDPTRWQAIYRLNRRAISDPDLIYPGQVLRIPGA